MKFAPWGWVVQWKKEAGTDGGNRLARCFLELRQARFHARREGIVITPDWADGRMLSWRWSVAGVELGCCPREKMC
jgi:hypothetical protein